MSPEPHPVARAEARLHGALEGTLQRRGWVPRVVTHVGYGTTEWVRVLARVLLAPPGGPRQRPDTTEPTDLRGWRRFLSASAVGVTVTVTVDGVAHEVTSDRDGYLDVRLPARWEPGWQSVSLRVGDDGEAAEVAASVRVVGPDTRLGLVSDIDDTVIVTMLPQPLVAFLNAFLLRESARRPVAGMAELYADVMAAHPDVFVVYLSTGAWNTAGALGRFLRHHGFPQGPLLLTDWGPTPTGWFRSGQDHKRGQLRRLLDELPDLTWLLVGDDGQHDPSIYADLAASDPDRIAGIAIRELSLGEQVVGHGTPVARDEHAHGPAGALEVRAPDGSGLRAALRARGMVL